MAAAALELTTGEARRLALRAQNLLGAPDRQGGVAYLVQRLGAVQLDTISVLARSHELVAYARLGAVGRTAVEHAYWGGAAFEYWAHAASVVPLDSWPLFAFRRRHYQGRAGVWAGESADGGRGAAPATATNLLARLRAEGPLTATDLGGAKNGTSWWGWSDVKHAVEHLLASGEVVCQRRVGWRRLYDLPERVVPATLRHDDLSDDACQRTLIRHAAAAMGVGTAADLADYFRLQRGDVVRLLPSCDLTPLQVQGWRDPAWADPAAIAAPGSGGQQRGGRHRTTLLSPFDSLIWDRKRTARLFGFQHLFEPYVPAHRRQHGYFTMPLLAGGSLIGRVDPARSGRTLIARTVVIEPSECAGRRLDAAARAVAVALREAATWVGCDGVAIERVLPESAGHVVRTAVSPLS